MTNEQSRLMLSIKEASEFLGVPKGTVYELAKTKDFPTIKMGRRKFIPIKALESWAERNVGKEVL